jgi:hypothetical protein
MFNKFNVLGTATGGNDEKEWIIHCINFHFYEDCSYETYSEIVLGEEAEAATSITSQAN